MTARALYVSAFIPDEHSAHAGGQAAFQNVVDLRNEGMEVTCLVCTTERPMATPTRELLVFQQSPLRMLQGWLYALISGFRLGCASWPIVYTRANVAFERGLRAELERAQYQVVFADFTQAILPVWRALQGIQNRPQIRACAHDIFAQRLLRDPSWLGRALLGPVTLTERKLLTSIDALITLSVKDAALATMLYDCRTVRVKPFVPPRWVARVSRKPETVSPRDVLFFANFNREENAEALAWFVSDVLPQVLSRYPDFRLVIAGTGSDCVPIYMESAAIHRVGFLVDPGPVFQHCRLTIAPLARGAGVKFKVLEALACQVPVLATSIALEGIPPSPLIHEATRAEFSAHLVRLLAE